MKRFVPRVVRNAINRLSRTRKKTAPPQPEKKAPAMSARAARQLELNTSHPFLARFLNNEITFFPHLSRLYGFEDEPLYHPGHKVPRVVGNLNKDRALVRTCIHMEALVPSVSKALTQLEDIRISHKPSFMTKSLALARARDGLEAAQIADSPDIARVKTARQLVRAAEARLTDLPRRELKYSQTIENEIRRPLDRIEKMENTINQNKLVARSLLVEAMWRIQVKTGLGPVSRPAVTREQITPLNAVQRFLREETHLIPSKRMIKLAESRIKNTYPVRSKGTARQKKMDEIMRLTGDSFLDREIGRRCVLMFELRQRIRRLVIEAGTRTKDYSGAVNLLRQAFRAEAQINRHKHFVREQLLTNLQN